MAARAWSSRACGWRLGEASGALVLGDVGRRVGGLLYPGAVGEAVERVLDELMIGRALDLRVELDGVGVVGVLVEAGVLAGGRAPALVPGVRMARALVEV